MLDRLKFYIMLKESCSEFDDESLEALLCEFETNLTSIKSDIESKKEKLEDFKRVKKENSHMLFATDIDNNVYMYGKAINNIHKVKSAILVDEIVEKDNIIAKKIVNRALSKRRKNK